MQVLLINLTTSTKRSMNQDRLLDYLQQVILARRQYLVETIFILKIECTGKSCKVTFNNLAKTEFKPYIFKKTIK